MSTFFRKDRSTRLRAIRAYLLVILICTFLLFIFSVISLNEQREKLDSLSSSNLRLIGEQAAEEVERKISLTAANCLSRENLSRLPLEFGQEQSPEQLRILEEQVRAIQKPFPIAEQFFVLLKDQLIYPQLSTPASGSTTLFQNENANTRAFRKLLSEAEDREFRWGELAEAAGVYDKAEQAADRPDLKALALSRVARALWKSNSRESAVKAYRRLLNSYGDQLNEDRVPYVLSLAAQPADLSEQVFPSGRKQLYEIYRQLCTGKWNLSADATESLLTRLEQRLGLSLEDRPKTDFLSRFQLIRAVDTMLKDYSGLSPSSVSQRAIEYGSARFQTFRVLVPGAAGHPDLIIGFSASMKWIEQSLLPEYASDLRNGIYSLSLARIGDADEGNAIQVSFQNLLPFWRLAISAKDTKLNPITASREVWFVGLSALMFLAVLGLSLFLLMRVSWEIRWFHLRSDFVSGVSHEFKTPLSLIRLYSETLADGDQTFSPEDRKNYIGIIVRESQRMSRLIDNVLDFSKIEQGRRHYELKEGDLGEAISQTVQDYSEYLIYQGFTVKFSTWPELPPVRFSAEQVSQMILNLMDNARKYSGKSRLIRVSIWAETGEVVVQVQDNGYGIASDEMEKIFKPFYRASKGGEQGGCGLGLYLVDQVMKEHGGRVEVESQLNRGSRFKLFFPIAGAKRAAASKHGRHHRTTMSEERVENL